MNIGDIGDVGGWSALTADQRDILYANFDQDYYRRTNPEIQGDRDDLFKHYIFVGWREGRNPNDSFKTLDYFVRHSAVVSAGVHPFFHHVLGGYAQADPMLLNSAGTPAAGDEASVAALDLPPLADLSHEELTDGVVPSVLAITPLALEDALRGLSVAEVDRLRVAFDSNYYLTNNPHVRISGVDPFVHFMTLGWLERRDPCDEFCTKFYLDFHHDIAASGMNPFVHWALYGKEEKRTSISIEQSIAKKRSHLKVSTIVPSVTPLTEKDAFQGLSNADIEKLRRDFNIEYYLENNPDVRISGADPFLHYMTSGWLQRRDPCDSFCTNYYLDLHHDIANSGMNPFIHWSLHGKDEKRPSISFLQRITKKQYFPKVSAIVPNYNHGRYLAQRIESILKQTYNNIEITILDDCSTDHSREIIDRYAAQYPSRIKTLYNDTNSGGVFNQWRKGVNSVDGELIWICESDDFCEPDFVGELVKHFVDDSVQMAFGRILETDINGAPNLWLDTYRDRAEPGIWDAPLVRPAADWFAHAFGVTNIIANVGGCLFRRAPVPLAVWQEAASYRVVGDWYLYLQIAGGGQIAWNPDAISYFRRHGSNTSSSSFTGTGFYTELERMMIALRSTWNVPDVTVIKFYSYIVDQYEHFNLEEKLGPLKAHCSLDKMLETSREKIHILISMLGFVTGSGENFPIQLANSLVEAGWIVSMLIFEGEEVNEHMRAALNPAVSVYDAAWVTEYGCNRFIQEAGVSLIHSHTIGAEMRFYFSWNLDPTLPYLVTLHGSYESSDIPPDIMVKLTESVDHFVYTADKNLLPLNGQAIPPMRFTKMANAMPIDRLPFPETRSDLGIAEDAIVFTLVARGIKRKGWRAAIEAFRLVRSRHPGRPMHLCLVGEGEEPDRHRNIYGNDRDISFLGYQARIHGLYRLSDVAIVPTRFVGESYPLCIIQSLQVGTPVVASDAGEIAGMLRNGSGVCGGIVVKAVRDTGAFISAFADAMEAILDDDLRRQLGEGAQELGHKYDMATLVETYGNLYSQILTQPTSPLAGV